MGLEYSRLQFKCIHKYKKNKLEKKRKSRKIKLYRKKFKLCVKKCNQSRQPD